VVYSHIAISAKDPRETERFYTKHFGFKRARVIDIGGGNQIVFIKAGDVYLEIFPAEGETPSVPVGGDGPHYPGVRHIAFKVDDVDAKLVEMGTDALITLGPLSFDAFIPGWRTVWVADHPDQANAAVEPHLRLLAHFGLILGWRGNLHDQVGCKRPVGSAPAGWWQGQALSTDEGNPVKV
jgi:glyoxylase I family protein